ncbi:putative loxhd1 [Schistosoma mansoni]|uniref:putative loxhd1 n=1 Tax=Schistosoma mansoni TaxID=6183 RepID=UPI00022DC4C5|nr:putative loxhd1 [Schistosoma mansoni]|eukprot:XP_018651766.1 putative loxhd1 [Schistosoma mansoni]
MNLEDSTNDDYLKNSKSRFSFHRKEEKEHKGIICCGHNTCHLDRYNLISSVKPFTARPYTLYKVVLTTADVPGAGTSAQIYITLKGEWGSSTRQKLRKEKVPTRNLRFYFYPGSTNTFSVVSPDLGGLHSVFIEHDSLRKSDSWLLESVQVFHPLTKKRYMFMCNHWFSLYKEDGLIARELFGIRSAKTKYSIVTVTGDQEGSGTNSKVYITIYGRTGITPRIELSQENKSTGKDILCAPFGRGTSTKFIVKAPNVGAITNIRIKQDESGNEPHWFLERVVVTDMSYPQWTYYFHLSCWLSSKYGDGKSCRLVRGYREPTGTGVETEYKLTFYTSDQKDAGTTGEVYVKLYGEKDSSREIWVNSINQKNRRQPTSYHFTRGSTVEVYLPPCPQLGEITKLKVGHNRAGSSPSWFLNKVIVDDLRMNRVFEFPCYAWITKPSETIIVCQKSIKKEEKEIIWQKIPLEIRLYTGDVPNAGTTAKVYLHQKTTSENKEDVYTTPYIWLEDGNYDRNGVTLFSIDLPVPKFISPLSQLVIGHDNTGHSPSWFFDKVQIYCPLNGVEQTFLYRKWLTSSKPGMKVEQILCEEKSLRKCTDKIYHYIIQIFTGNKPNSGTNANIFINIFGEKGDCGERWLGRSVNRNSELFQQNQMDEFVIEAVQLGSINKICIGHEERSPGYGWYLAKIVLTIKENPKYKLTFECYRWFDVGEDDGQIVRELFAHSSLSAIAYNVTVLTGTCRNAGTVANVFVHLYGLQGESKDMQLKHKETEITKFEAGKSEEFILACGKLGEIKKIKIWHDSIAPHSGWFLDEVVVIDYFLGRRYVFHVNRWLAKNEADGLISLDLQPTSIINIERKSSYEVIVKTGGRKYAGTDSHVYITMFGINSESKEYHLANSKTHNNKFEQNHEDLFNLNAVGLGSLKKIRVRHTNTGIAPGWFLDYILIRESIQQKKMEYFFPCYQWLSATRLDGLVIRELSVASENIFERWKSGHDISDDSRLILEDQSTIYHVRIHTGSQSNISSDANVQIQLYGDKDFTGNIRLYKAYYGKEDILVNKFQAGQIANFIVKAINIGNIKKIRIEHDTAVGSARWFVERVEVEARKLGLLWKFECNRFITPQQPELILYPEPKDISFVKPMTNYQIKTFTSDISGAETTSSVYIQLYGNDSLPSSIRRLHQNNDSEQRFQRNKIDTFYVELEELQEPFSKLRIWHNDKGSSTDWHLNKVEIRKIKTNQYVFVTYIFPCNKWLSRNMDQAALERELIPSHMLQDQNGVLQFERQLSPKWLMNTYEVRITTGDKAYAGTDASVYITLFGENGDSGERKLTKSLTHRNKFERGQTDVFQLEIVDLGKINKVRIRHDNSGVNPSWYLSTIEVFNISKSQSVHGLKDQPNETHHLVKYIFNCEAWLSTEHDEKVLDRFFSAEIIKPQDLPGIVPKTSKDIVPHKLIQDLSQGKKALETIPYLITVITGSDRKAGTPGPVWISCVDKDKMNSEKFILCDCYNRTMLKRGTTRYFRFAGVKLNDLTEIQVGNDAPESPSMGWYIQSLYLSFPTIGKMYLFDCKEWLSTNRGNKKRTCNLKISNTNIVKFKPKITYHLKITTANVKRAGTDCSINLQIFGTNGVTNCYILEKTSNRFAQGITDNISLEMEDVGKLLKMRIGHDNQGKNKHWNLSCVEVTVANTNQLYRFVYDDWLSLTYGKRKSLWADLPAMIGDTVQLKETCLDIFVKTGNMPASSTDANVYVQLFGEYGDSGEILLKQTVSNQKPFQNNSIDHFKIPSILKLGNLARCRIWHDNKGSSPNWYCEWLEVKEVLIPGEKNLACNWKFAFNKWLSVSDDNKQLLRDAPCSEVYMNDSKGHRTIDQESIETLLTTADSMNISDLKDNPEGKLVYEVVIETGNLKDSGTTCDAWIILEGKHGRSPKLELVNQVGNPILQINQMNTFQLPSFPLGDLETIRLGIQERNINKQTNPNDIQSQKWFCEKVSIKDPVSKRTYIFTIHQWLSVTPTSNLKKDVLVNYSKIIEDPYKKAFNELKNKQTVMYKVSIYTGTKGCANTDANIFITMFSTTPGLNSGRIALKRENNNLFDRKQLDEFYVESIDLESIQRIIIEHDNTGVSPDWYLDKVLITNQTNNQIHLFQCYQWISKKKGDCRLWKELLVSN